MNPTHPLTHPLTRRPGRTMAEAPCRDQVCREARWAHFPAIRERWHRVTQTAQAGMSTAEYAIGTLAACTFAALLIAVVKSPGIRSALTGLITTALGLGK